MKYTVRHSETRREFNEINIGEIFLDDDDTLFIKIPEVMSVYNHDIYNCVRLDEGGMWHFFNTELVRKMTDYNFEIKL